MDATPRGIVLDLALVFRRTLRKEHAVVRQLHRFVALNKEKCIGERHLAMLVMVAVGLSVRRNVYKLRLRALFKA